MRCICTIPNRETAPLITSTAAKPRKTLVAMERRIPHILSREGARAGADRVQLGGMRRALLLAGVALAACGFAAVPGRAQVPGLDRLSGELTAVEVDLPGADLTAVRGPAGWVLVGASIDSGRVVGGAAPECALRRTPSGALAAQTGRCGGRLGADGAPPPPRAFLISARGEAIAAAPVVLAAAR